MRGKVLSYSDLDGLGLISGDDGARYDFVRGGLQGGIRIIHPGTEVDFQIDGTRAINIYAVSTPLSVGQIGDKNKIASVKGTPILTIIGDNAKDHPRWKSIRNNAVVYSEAFKAAGGDFTLVDLPDAGIKGNSHMMMMDKNSDQIAEFIQNWLVKKGLSD